ncbi:thioredoxin family protein [Methylocystis sp.]|uniref:thioredoxin family protein n=1 Tax=Methylocystis sp. TaxID=1911079 RepID=UPI003DA48923
MIVKVLGPGCHNCRNLENATRRALESLGTTAELEKVTDYATIARYGVMATPALVIDERVVCSGRVPGDAEIKEYLLAAAVREPAGEDPQT